MKLVNATRRGGGGDYISEGDVPTPLSVRMGSVRSAMAKVRATGSINQRTCLPKEPRGSAFWHADHQKHQNRIGEAMSNKRDV